MDPDASNDGYRVFLSVVDSTDGPLLEHPRRSIDAEAVWDNDPRCDRRGRYDDSVGNIHESTQTFPLTPGGS